MATTDDLPSRDRPDAGSTGPALRIGAWRVEPSRNLLVQGGRRRRLEPKVMAVLLTLARRPGEVVSRTRLFTEVWPDVVVGDDALTMAVSKLRRALGDDRQGARYIETIPKTGYRLVARVDPGDPGLRGEPPPPADPRLGDPPDSLARASPRAETAVPGRLRPRRPIAGALLAIGLLLAVGWGLLHLDPPPSTPAHPTPSTPTPSRESILTSMAGSEYLGRLSPDGKWLVFARGEPDEPGLFVQRRDCSVPKRIVVGEASVTAPAWSPDSRRIAALDCRSGADRSCDLFLVDRDGSAFEPILTYRASRLVGLDWSPDGKMLAIARHPAPGRPSALALVDLESGAVRPLTEPPEGHLGDARPAFSRDGRRIAFTRGPDLIRHELYVVDLEGSAPRRIPVAPSRIWGLTWSADDRELIIASNREGPFRLFRVALASGALRWIPASAREVRFPWVVGEDLLFEAFHFDADLWRLSPEGREQRLTEVASTRWEISPRHSPDGSSFAFVSTRTGSPQVWLQAPGAALRRLGELDADYLGRPEWSPDGARIAVEGLSGEGTVLYLFDVATGIAEPFPFPSASVHRPRWSRDGRHLYVASDRGGRPRIWRAPLDGGEPVAVTPGIVAAESLDGEALYVQRRNDRNLWLVPLGDGAGDIAVTAPEEARLLVDDLAPGHVSNWLVTDEGILYPTPSGAGGGRGPLDLMLFDPRTGTRRILATLHGSLFAPGLSASRDATDILVSLREPIESELRVIEGFR